MSTDLKNPPYMDRWLSVGGGARLINRRRFLGLTLGATGVAALERASIPKAMQRVERRSWALGAEVSLVAYHEDGDTAERAVAAAFQALDQLEDSLSLYRPHSELCRLNRDGVLQSPHADVLAVVRESLEWARLSGGAFDPTVQPLWALHAAGGASDSVKLQAAQRLVDWRRVQADAREIRLGPGQQLTLNGIAQGFAADRVREVFLARGIRHGLANTGEFCALGAKSDATPWQIGVQHPRARDAYVAVAPLRDRFLATSGDYENKFSEDFSAHHIFDPATGRSPSELSSVTVVARTGMAADALSTAIFVLGAARGFELAAARRDVEVLLVMKNGEVLASPNFPKIA